MALPQTSMPAAHGRAAAVGATAAAAARAADHGAAASAAVVSGLAAVTAAGAAVAAAARGAGLAAATAGARTATAGPAAPAGGLAAQADGPPPASASGERTGPSTAQALAPLAARPAATTTGAAKVCSLPLPCCPWFLTKGGAAPAQVDWKPALLPGLPTAQHAAVCTPQRPGRGAVGECAQARLDWKAAF